MFGNNANFNLPHYSFHRHDGHFNVTPHGGVALFIHESLPFQTVDLNCALQAVAAVVQLDVPITICSLYASKNHSLTQESLSKVLDQLPAPMVVLGDFNSYNTLWGCRTTDLRDQIVEDVVNRRQLIILNNGSPTRISYNAESAKDLAISPRLASDMIWSVAPSHEDSDQCIIFVTIANNQVQNSDREILRIRKADWEMYEHHDGCANYSSVRNWSIRKTWAFSAAR